MSAKKDAAIEKIIHDFEKFSNLILTQLDLLDQIISSYTSEIPGKIMDQIKKNEAKLDDYEIQMSERIINIIVLYNPVASDLRKIIACYRMVLNLERIGDLIMGTVSYIDRIKDPAIFKKSSTLIDNMLILSTQMVTRALLSYTNRDKEDAIWTIKNDSVVDELNHKLLKKSILKEKLPDETRKMLMSFINIKSIITNIERIADHATNIAEASIYAMEGKDMRHRNMENE